MAPDGAASLPLPLPVQGDAEPREDSAVGDAATAVTGTGAPDAPGETRGEDDESRVSERPSLRNQGMAHGVAKGRGRGRGFRDILCVGFAVSLCLNFGSMTARRGGFFTAEVACISPGASTTLLVSCETPGREPEPGVLPHKESSVYCVFLALDWA